MMNVYIYFDTHTVSVTAFAAAIAVNVVTFAVAGLFSSYFFAVVIIQLKN